MEFEGKCEEIQTHHDQLTGHRVRVTVLDELPLPGPPVTPNTAMLAALDQIEIILRNMPPKPVGRDYFADASSGEMYDYDDK